MSMFASQGVNAISARKARKARKASDNFVSKRSRTHKMSKTFINFSTAQVFINKLNRTPLASEALLCTYHKYIRIFSGSHFHEQHSHLTF